ncbi:MAG: hypothetical protein KDA51_11145, partial [Planctomycetales bacterium]|nr:hypothetical protein [Planctomycetales bacterium]
CEMYTHTGRIQESIEMGKQAIGQLEALHQSNPDDSELTVALAYALTRMDLALCEILSPEEAARHKQTITDILASLPERSDEILSVGSPNHTDGLQLPFTSLRDALTECRIHIAVRLPDLKQAEKHLQMALAELADAEVADSVAGRRVGLQARAEQFLGSKLADFAPERKAEAESHLQRSAALFQQLAAEFPQMVAYRAGWAFALGGFGKSQVSAGKVKDGKLWLTQAIELLTELTTQYPDNPEFHHRLAGDLNNLGNSLSGAEALAKYDEAVTHETIAILLSPLHREYRRWLAIQYRNLANSYWQAQDSYKAESVWRSAIVNADYLAELEPAVYDDSHRQAHNWLALGESLLASSENSQETNDAFRTASELFHNLFQDAGHKPHDACMLAATYAQWSQLQEKQGNLDQAKQMLERAIAHEQEALQLEPDQPDHDLSLSEYRRRLEKLSESQPDA